MWLLLVLLVVGCGACVCSECIDHTLRCTHRRRPFPTRKGLPETREALDRVCRNQNEYYDCLQNIPGAERTAGSPMSADKLDRLDGEYMLSELCTDGMKARNNYLKQAACINKQKTGVCLSPEFLVILSANERALSKCSVQNKVTSCISMMLAMNCGADAGFLYRRLLHIANDGDVLCNSGEDLGEVFSIFKLEENEAARSDSLDPRIGGKTSEDSIEKHLYRRVGEIVGTYHSEHNSSESVGPSTTHYLKKQFEADNFTLLTYDWKEMKPREDWVLKTLYGRTQPFQTKSDFEMHQESSNLKHYSREMCFPFEINSKKQTNINEQCFDKLLEDIVEKQDPVEYSEQHIYASSGDPHDKTTRYQTESMTEVITDPVLSSNEFKILIPDEISLNVDPVLEYKHVDKQDHTEHNEQGDMYTHFGDSHGETNIYLDKIVNEQKLLKEYEPSYEKNEIDLESKNSYKPLDTFYLQDDLAEEIPLYTSEFVTAYPRFPELDKSESIDSIRRNIYTITDSFPHRGNLKSSFPTTFGANEYLVEESPEDDYEQDPKSRETEQLDKELDILDEIVERIGEIEVAHPVKHHIGIDKKPENAEILTIEEVSELNQYNAVLDSNEGGIQTDAQTEGEHSTWFESNKDLEVENFNQEHQECKIEEKDSNKHQITLNCSEVYSGHFLQKNDGLSVEKLMNTEDLGSGFTEDETIESLANLNHSNLIKNDLSTEDMNRQEIEQHLETSVNNYPQADEISNDDTYIDTNEVDSSGPAEADNTQELNIQLTSDSLTNLEDLEDQFIRVNVHEYMPFEEKRVEFQGEVRDEIKFTNVDKFLNSDERETMEESGSYEIPAVNFYTTNYDFLDEPLKNVKFIDNEGSGYSDNTLSASRFDELKVMGTSEDSESYRHEKAKTYIYQTMEGTNDLESKLSQEQTKFFDKQPTLIEISDEDVRKYNEQRSHESENLLVLLTDEESTKLDSSEVEYVKDLDSSQYSLSDIAGIGVAQTELENEPTVETDMLSGDIKIELLKGLDSTTIPRNTFDESTAQYKFVSESSLDNLKLESTESVYLTETDLEEPLQKITKKSEEIDSVSESPLHSLELEGSDSAYLSESELDLMQILNFDLPDHETSNTIDHSIFEVPKGSDATEVLEILDSSTHNYLISEDIGLSEEEHSLATEKYLGYKRTDEAEYSSFTKGTEDPKEVIMNHLDNLLLEDGTDHSSGESSTIDKEMNNQESGTPINNIEISSIAQMSNEKPKCDIHECLQLVSKNLAVENARQNLDSYRIATNRIKIPTFSWSDLAADRLISNKVHSSCDSIFALVRENGSQVSISDMKRRVPSLQFFDIPGDATSYACYILNRQSPYLAV